MNQTFVSGTLTVMYAILLRKMEISGREFEDYYCIESFARKR